MVKNGNQYFYMNKLIAIDKSLLDGQVITVIELLNGLKSNVFSKSNDVSPVTICTQKGLEEPLTSIFKCSDCDAIHFESGYLNKSEYKMGDIVYADVSNQLGVIIGKGELVSILEEIAQHPEMKNSPIVIACGYDTTGKPMTMLSKCSDLCQAIHISSIKEQIIMN